MKSFVRSYVAVSVCVIPGGRRWRGGPGSIWPAERWIPALATLGRDDVLRESYALVSPGLAVGAEAFLHAEHGHRHLEALLPQQRFHGDVQRLVLHRELVHVVVVRGVVVHRPTRRRQHEGAGLPLVHLALDGRAAGGVAGVVDRRRALP